MNTVHSENVMTRRSYWLQRATLQARRQREYRESNKAREGEAYVIRELERLRKYNGLRTQRQRYEKALKRGRTEIKKNRRSPGSGVARGGPGGPWPPPNFC